MTQIQFYHLTATPLERALPKLLEKAYEHGYRTLLVLDSEEKLAFFNQSLWTYHPNSFLPHGTAQEPSPELQPVFLSTTLEAPNNPDLLFVTDGRMAGGAKPYKRILDIFDGNNPEKVAEARARWKEYKDQGHTLSYFSQTEKGLWEERKAA